MNPFTAIVAFVYATQARLEEEKGATAVEYGLMVGLIAAVIIGTVMTLGGQLNDLFVTITNKLGVAGG
jgi:pilus assembly protein Flp/PilA